MEVDLIQRIEEFKPAESYILTFSIDLHYYESFLLPLLQQSNCLKNVIIADSNKVNETFEHKSSFLNKLGREYMLMSLHADYAFHPKIYLFKKSVKGATELMCFLGSGNLTYPGLNTNQEIFFEETCDGNKRVPFIWDEIADYFNSIFDLCPGESTKLAKTWFYKDYPQSTEGISNSAPSLIRYPYEKAIFDQFISKIGGKKVQELFLTAPFYDDDLSALKKIITECQPKKVSILLQPNRTDVDSKRLVSFIRSYPAVTLRAFEPENHRARYLHAKIIVAITTDGEHVAAGSANISDVALFGNARAFNYEANIYQLNSSRKSVLDTLEIEKISTPLSLNNLPQTFLEKVIEKPRVVSSVEILSAECYGGFCRLVISGIKNQELLDAELLLFDDTKKTISITKKKDTKNGFSCDAKKVQGALSIRIIDKKDVYSKWIPVLFLGEIERRTKRYFTKAEKLKESYLRAEDELSKDNYLDLIIDSLISDSLKLIEVNNRVPRVVGKKDEAIKGRAMINVRTEIPTDAQCAQPDVNDGFAEGLDYVISALRDRRHIGSIEQDLTNTEQDKDFEEYDEKIQAVKEETAGDIDILYSISRRLKVRRRTFLKSEIIQSPLAQLSYFSLIVLPHIPHLGKFYIGDDGEKHLCVEDDEWIRFILDSCAGMGNVFFKAKGKEDWPSIVVDALKEDLFEISVCSTLYSFAIIYPFIKRRVSLLDDEGFDYYLSINRLIILFSSLMRSYLNIDGRDINKLKDRLIEIREHFPCGWSYLDKSITEIFSGISFFIDKDLKKAVKWEFGELVSSPSKGLLLNIQGQSAPLWK